MEHFEIFFIVALIAYVLAFISYVGILINKNNFIKILANTWASIGLLSHTSGLILRWYIGGWNHPPLTNLYESLLLFIWGMVLIQLFLIKKYKIQLIGIFVMIVAILGMGLASLNPNKAIEPLVPALQSYWLHFHVFLAAISYGFFLASAVFALLYVIKSQRIRPVVNAIFEGFSLFCLVVSWASSALIFSPVGFNKMVPQNGKLAMTEEIIQISGLHYLVIFLFLVFLFNLYFHIKESLIQSEVEGQISRKLSTLSFILYSAIMIWLIFSFLTIDGLSALSAPYQLGLITLGYFSLLLRKILFLRYGRFIELLPRSELLDQLSYKSILVSMPLLTLVIVTGSVWAHYAWGRYWGWDPKETWSFITWLIYNLYLHLRLQKDWQGIKIAFISIIGFMAVVFTYLGVNLFLSGLHAYN